MADLSRFSTADLEAMAKNDLGSVSDQGLAMLHDAAAGPSAAESLGRGAIQGATLGFGDEMAGLGGALGTMAGQGPGIQARDPALQAKLDAAAGPQPTFVQSYRQTRDEARATNDAAREAHPYLYGGAEMAGSLLPMAAGGAAAKAAGVTVGPVAGSAAIGGAMAAGGSNADLTQGQYGQAGIDTGIGTAIGAVIPRAVDAAGVAAGKVGQGAGWLSKKLFSSRFGVTEHNAAAYLADRAGINAAPEIETIKNGIDAQVAKLADAVDTGKMNVSDAKAALAELQRNTQNQLTDQGVEAGAAVRHTNDMFQRAAANVIQPIKETPAPTAIAHDVINAVDDLKQSVVDRANEAWKPIEASKITFPTKVIKGQLTQGINGLKVGGAQGGAVGQQSQAAIGSLQALRDQLDQLPDKLPMGQVKQIIQQLDKDITYTGGAGQFMDPASQEKLVIRRGLDKYLKSNIPGYAEAMAPLAKDTDLLHQVSRPFGDERTAIGRLGQVASPRGAIDRQMLQSLEQATGRPGAFTTPIDQFTRAQAILKNPKAVEGIQQALPEYGAREAAAARKASMTPEWRRGQLESTLSNAAETQNLATAQAGLERAQAAYEPVKARLQPGSTQGAVQSFGTPKGAPIETRNALQALDRQAGTNFTEQAHKRAVLDSFSKPYTHGSRNTLGGAILGALGGFLFGGMEGAGAGIFAGKETGQLMDRYGPAVGKKILDGVAALRDNPSVQTIRSMGLPSTVQRELERELNIYVAMKNSAGQPLARVAQAPAESANRTPATPPARGEAAWAQRGLQALGVSDPALSSRLMQDPKARALLIQAGGVSQGSKAMKSIQSKIQKGWGTP